MRVQIVSFEALHALTGEALKGVTTASLKPEGPAPTTLRPCRILCVSKPVVSSGWREDRKHVLRDYQPISRIRSRMIPV